MIQTVMMVRDRPVTLGMSSACGNLNAGPWYCSAGFQAHPSVCRPSPAWICSPSLPCRLSVSIIYVSNIFQIYCPVSASSRFWFYIYKVSRKSILDTGNTGIIFIPVRKMNPLHLLLLGSHESLPWLKRFTTHQHIKINFLSLCTELAKFLDSNMQKTTFKRSRTLNKRKFSRKTLP